ncbi:hypothetical protein A2617_01080 [Candidatus Daviesbacteria bacterium RIFOXYD1_FULL_41_10]|uniref:Uncharacterized protein n=2 Tax=Candidatus Daviesiibacteriota TaxID=1752718 RepID=A0A1F5N056_9BACT|nr:MAG: hypothetical protein UU67_C0010G0020 [Candidatus Daviesbacteria bacterium GW2011_GWB1_41_5]OGE71026.1 MAG: hypothetical protein A2617_01080 [Candidatus Daviesbacteria bacterium RIFOXYD1_FULL_41_10]
MDAQFKKDLIDILGREFDKRFAKKFQEVREALGKDMIQVFNQGFDSLVLPQFEDIDKNFTGIKRRLDSLEDRVGVIDRKLDSMNNKWIDCDFRLKKIERIPVIAHQIKK